MASLQKNTTTILGIDPGTNILGFGVIRIVGKTPQYVDMGVIDLRKEKNAYDKLWRIFSEIGTVCDTWSPDEMALESPFYGKNAQVVLKLGRAQGAAMLAAVTRGIPITEYAPRKAKVAVTGNGAASKVQVSTILQRILGIDIEEKFLDATDALAIAMCHFYEMTSPLAGLKTGGSWEKFIAEHPDRVK
ncbi:MAG: crossover junction endodeoxyribonuclease RuvC [Candidatus Cryptobacteroides sp.]